MNYFKPLTNLFGEISQSQDFNPARMGEKYSREQSIGYINSTEISLIWSNAFKLSAATRRLEEFSIAIKECPYYSAWGILTITQNFKGFIESTYGLNTRNYYETFFELAKDYSTDSRVLVKPTDGLVQHMQVENQIDVRKMAICQAIFYELFYQVAIGQNRLYQDDYQYHKEIVEIALDVFDDLEYQRKINGILYSVKEKGLENELNHIKALIKM